MDRHACVHCGQLTDAARDLCSNCLSSAIFDATKALDDAEVQAGQRFDKSIAKKRAAYIKTTTLKQSNALARLCKLKHDATVEAQEKQQNIT
jgi:hypothetical protein